MGPSGNSIALRSFRSAVGPFVSSQAVRFHERPGVWACSQTGPFGKGRQTGTGRSPAWLLGGNEGRNPRQCWLRLPRGDRRRADSSTPPFRCRWRSDRKSACELTPKSVPFAHSSLLLLRDYLVQVQDQTRHASIRGHLVRLERRVARRVALAQQFYGSFSVGLIGTLKLLEGAQ